MCWWGNKNFVKCRSWRNWLGGVIDFGGARYWNWREFDWPLATFRVFVQFPESDFLYWTEGANLRLPLWNFAPVLIQGTINFSKVCNRIFWDGSSSKKAKLSHRASWLEEAWALCPLFRLGPLTLGFCIRYRSSKFGTDLLLLPSLKSQKETKTTAPRIPAWSPTVVLTRRHTG